MAAKLKSEVKRIYDQLVSERSVYENRWERICELLFPAILPIIGYETKADAQYTGDDIFDTTGVMSLNAFANMLLRNVTPETSQWHQLRGVEKATTGNVLSLFKRKETPRKELDEINQKLFSQRYASGTNFSANMVGIYKGMGALGDSFLYVDHTNGRFNYKFIPIQMIFFELDYNGDLSLVIHKIPFTKEQLLEEFADNKDKLPSQVKNETDHTKQFWVLHCVQKNDKYKRGSIKTDELRYKSEYVFEETQDIISQGGYSTMPYIRFNFPAALNEKLGNGPGWNLLPDLESVNELARLGLRSAQYQADPPMGTTDDDVLYDTKVNPGDFINGAISADGTMLIQPINLVNGGQQSEIEYQRRKQNIREGFIIGLSQIYQDGGEKTATEVVQNSSEMASQIAPIVSMIQNNSLPKLIERELDLLIQNGILDPKDVASVDLSFDSPANRMLENDRLKGIYALVQQLPMLGQIDPVIPGMINGEELMNMLIYANNLPNEVLKSYEEANQAYQKRVKSAQKIQAAEIRKTNSEANKNNANAKQEGATV